MTTQYQTSVANRISALKDGIPTARYGTKTIANAYAIPSFTTNPYFQSLAVT
jgi:hypothetical protein